MIREMIQDRYIFNYPLAQCHEPSRTANPIIKYVKKQKRNLVFNLLLISLRRLLVLDHSHYSLITITLYPSFSFSKLYPVKTYLSTYGDLDGKNSDSFNSGC